MKLAVVILNWNGKNLLKQFLPTVIAYSKEAEIYIVDNASTDDSVSFVQSNFPTVFIIQNETNRGYAQGYNEALKKIDTDVYCLLNNDVEVSKNWLQPIVNRFNSSKNTAIVQPKILDYHNKDYFEYAGAAGGYIDQFAFPYCRGRLFNTIERDSGQYNGISNIFWASGACLFIRKSVFNKLEGFDGAFFAHMEEIDLCWRSFNLGYKTIYIGESTVYHVGGATLNNSSHKKTYLNFRNSLFTLTKNTSLPLIKTVFLRLIMDGIASLKFLFELKLAHFLAVLHAHYSYYKHFSKLLKQRKKLPRKKGYYQSKSIVWEYFVARKRYFNEIKQPD